MMMRRALWIALAGLASVPPYGRADLLPVLALGRHSQLDAQLQAILYDDCGARGRQPHVVNGGLWTFAEQDVAAPLPARTVAFDATALRVRYTDLDSAARYALRVTYTTERTNPRTQRLSAEGQTVHADLALPLGEARQFEFPLPPDLAADGTIDLSFELVSGHNAEVSEVWLLSDRQQPRLSLDVASDLRGHLTVTALDGLLQPIPGADARVAWPGVQALRPSTDAEGHATFLFVGKTPREGNVEVSVRAGGLTQTRTIPLASIFLARPALTPVPDMVAGVRKPTLSLNGTWRFSPSPAEGFQDVAFDDRDWTPIDVPGEWVMQGHTVESGKPAGYRRTLMVPSDWRDRVVKLRFDGVYSKCEVWLNGTTLGVHEGGFTSFEVDATAAVLPGRRNVLALAVTSESLADTLASASSYARHPLGGITRKVSVFALPRTHLTRFHVTTDLDSRYRDAQLVVTPKIVGDKAELQVDVRSIGGLAGEDPVGTARVPGATGTLRFPVSRPQLWDSEHPTLYTVQAEVLVGGKVVERVSRRIGFREVEVRGSQLLVNGRPVKLHGVCRHEVHPQRGRSLTSDIWKRDVELLKGANVNFVRTAHYPPAEEFIALCDEAGIYVQEEGPFCWVGGGNESSAETLGLMLQSHAEMVERDLSHPSVIIWDIANESAWGANFARMTEYAHAEDPTRPTLFSGAAVGAVDEPAQRPDIDDWHYPGPGGPERCANAERPVTFGEYCHLNCYNVAEVEADLGLRDYWGRALQPMWDAMYVSPGCLGGTIWCWADDVFELPGKGRVGYGEWGVIDGYQRPKPEWWHVRKSYSPIRIPAPHVEAGATITLPIQNRFNHTNLSEVECRWQLGKQSGTLSLDLAPHGAGTLNVPAAAEEGDVLRLEFREPSGRTIDEYALPVGRGGAIGPLGIETLPASPATTPESLAPLLAEKLGSESPWPDIALTEQGTGRDLAGRGEVIDLSGKREGHWLRLSLRKQYPVGLATFELVSDGGTLLSSRFRLAYTGPEALVREIGQAWTVGKGFTQLSWTREGQWSVYPDDHIGRLTGTALASPEAQAGRLAESWSALPDQRGCNDFRSTKCNVRTATLSTPDGRTIRFSPEGSGHIRATAEGEAVVVRLLDFSGGGGEGFLRGHYAKDFRTIKPGDILEGDAAFRVEKPSTR